MPDRRKMRQGRGGEPGSSEGARRQLGRIERLGLELCAAATRAPSTALNPHLNTTATLTDSRPDRKTVCQPKGGMTAMRECRYGMPASAAAHPGWG